MVLLAPDNLSNAPDENGCTDGDDNQRYYVGLFGRCDGEALKGNTQHTCQNDRQHNCNHHGHSHGCQGNGRHTANHQKLALGKIDDVAGVINQGKTEGYQGVSRTDSNPGEQVL